jgi:hypothetical protein
VFIVRHRESFTRTSTSLFLFVCVSFSFVSLLSSVCVTLSVFLCRAVFCADLTQAAERMPQSEPPVSGPTASPTAQPSPPPLLVSAALETGAPLRLLIRCPNYWSGYGDNRDAFLPNPSATSLREIQMFEFLGKLMGIALRTKEVVVDIDFPSLIWKSLLAIKPDRSDLAAIDLSCVNALEVIEGTSTTTHERLTPQNFNEFIFESFTTRTTDGRIVELKPHYLWAIIVGGRIDANMWLSLRVTVFGSFCFKWRRCYVVCVRLCRHIFSLSLHGANCNSVCAVDLRSTLTFLSNIHNIWAGCRHTIGMSKTSGVLWNRFRRKSGPYFFGLCGVALVYLLPLNLCDVLSSA